MLNTCLAFDKPPPPPPPLSRVLLLCQHNQCVCKHAVDMSGSLLHLAIHLVTAVTAILIEMLDVCDYHQTCRGDAAPKLHCDMW